MNDHPIPTQQPTQGPCMKRTKKSWSARFCLAASSATCGAQRPRSWRDLGGQCNPNLCGFPWSWDVMGGPPWMVGLSCTILKWMMPGGTPLQETTTYQELGLSETGRIPSTWTWIRLVKTASQSHPIWVGRIQSQHLGPPLDPFGAIVRSWVVLLFLMATELRRCGLFFSAAGLLKSMDVGQRLQ